MSAALASPLAITPFVARRFARAAVGLDLPHASVAAAIYYHGFIQIDPINVCGRMHDLILRNRVTDYREGDLMRYLHGRNDEADESDREPRINGGDGRPARPRTEDEANRALSSARKLPNARAARPSLPPSLPANSARPSVPAPLPAERRTGFEHHAPDTGNLVAFPLDAWPHLQAAMLARQRRTGAWSGRLTPRERELAPALLAEITARGPLGSEDFDDPRRAHRVVWGAASLVKSTLQKLFFHGRLLIAQRANNRRRYDLPERVLPTKILQQPAAPAADTARWLVLLKLRQRRLVTLRRQDVPLVADVVQPLAVEGCPTLYCLRSDLPHLEAAQAAAARPSGSDRSTPRPAVAPQERTRLNPELSTPPTIRLLAPLDPLIYDRRLTAALWGFDYTWEAYTPPAKRVRGYYALPVLVGTELVGHVDPKADRAARRLRVVSRRVRRGHKIATGVRDFARWLGLR